MSPFNLNENELGRSRDNTHINLFVNYLGDLRNNQKHAGTCTGISFEKKNRIKETEQILVTVCVVLSLYGFIRAQTGHVSINNR